MNSARRILTCLVRSVGRNSEDIRQCRFGKYSCPQKGPENSNRCAERNGDRDVYCQCGFTGPLCSECDSEYFAAADGQCTRCSDAQGHTMSITIGSVLVACGMVVAVVAIRYRRRIQTSAFYAEVKLFKKIAGAKCRILFFTAQVQPAPPIATFPRTAD